MTKQDEKQAFSIWAMPIYMTGIHEGTKRKLVAAGYATLGDVNNAKREELLRLPGFGMASYGHVLDYFRSIKEAFYYV